MRSGTFEERVKAWEEEFLWERATPSYPADRRDAEPDSPVRTPFQRDRDRVVHSKAFRRLKHKTQVFIAPEGDHYRTRLTHTLETCCIARTVARALGLNEDLTEAIGLGHDLGHPPFGHIGEEALDEALRERGAPGFKHNEHSLRVVDVLERDGKGLNLTEQVRDGILNHTGPNKPATSPSPTMSAGRCCGCASSCSTTSISGRRRAASTTACIARSPGCSTTISTARRRRGKSCSGSRTT